MSSFRITIDGRETHVAAGTTVLDAARALGIAIPTLCHRDGCRPGTACMVCVVRVEGLRRLVPSCAFPVRDGLVVHSDAPDVQEARRAAIELLMSEHVGDCEGPCRRACPAHMDIPLMLRLTAAGRLADALQTIKHDIALPAVLGRICPAPCEKVCRRGRVDLPVAICLVKRLAADIDLAGNAPWRPPSVPASGKRVGIVGAGPAGLAAAYYLQARGHACTVFDEHPEPGGTLRRAVPEQVLPRAVLDAEIAQIRAMGVEFRLGVRVGEALPFHELRKGCDAVILAVGALPPGDVRRYGVRAGARGIDVAAGTYLTDQPGIWAVGAAIRPVTMAIRSCADGKEAAVACHQYLVGEQVVGLPKRFNCVIGKVADTELAEFMRDADAGPRREPVGGASIGFTAAEAATEAQRCLHCDCRKAENCHLRELVERLGAQARRFAEGERAPVELIRQHPAVVYEPGKCIRCGLCVRLTEQEGEALGLGFVGRGYAMRVSVPFSETLSKALTHSARLVVDACPTGALAWR